MRKKIIICALSVLLLILSGVLAFYLHRQNRPIAGLSGDNRTLLRVWMLRTPGGAARWVETQLSAYERQHPGVLIYLRQVSADELTAEETLLPDVVLYRPGDITDPDGLFLPISGDAPIFAGLLSGGRQVAYPLCWGAWVLAVDSAYDPQTAATPAPTTLLGRPSSTLSPEQTPALFPLEKADAANCPLLSPGGCALYALREIFANQAYPRWTDDFAQLPSDTVYQRFRERKCASAMLTTGQVVAFSGLTSAGKGFPFRVMVGQTVTTEQVLLSSICAGAQDGAADLLSFLVSRGAQEQLVHQGLFSVREDLALYPSGWAAEVEQAARRAIVMPDAFQSDEALRQKHGRTFGESCQCLYSYHQHPAVSRGHLRLNFAVAEVNCPACCGIGSIFVRTAGIDEQHASAALLRLFRVFVLDGVVPFIGAVVAPDEPEHHIGVECVHFFGSAVRPEVAAQPDGEGFAAIGEFLEVRALAVVGIRLSVLLPADADAAEAVDDLAVRADEGAAAVQDIPVALDEAEGDSGGVLSGGVLQLADGGGIKRESHIAVSGIRPAQAVEALEGGFAEHNEVGTISGGLGEGGGHGGEVMRNILVPDGSGGEGDFHACVSSIRG